MPEEIVFRKESRWKEVWRLFRKNRLAVIGLVLFSLTVLTCFIAPLFIPAENVTKQSISNAFAHFSAEHPAGTDHFGRDQLARLLYGGRTSISVGIISVFLSLILGGTLGMAASYYDRLDNIIMRFVDILASIPPILMALTIVAAFGANLRNVVLAISVARIPSYCRITRSAVLSIVDQEYIEAARAGGTSDFRILFKHVFPNCLGTIIVQTTMSLASMILSCASLSFIGMGVQPPAPEWGAMLSEAREFMRTAPQLMILPGLAVLMISTELNLIGDGLRDAFDPRLKT